MQVHWRCVAAAAKADGRVLVLIDYSRPGEATARREELVLDPALPQALDEQLRRKARERAENVALAARVPVLDGLVGVENNEEV